MGLLSKFFNKKTADVAVDSTSLAFQQAQDNKRYETEIASYTFPDGTIMENIDEVLDVNSPETIAKFKHNLKVLIAEAKQKGKIYNFYLIREDDFFPKNWEWNVLSDQTNLEPITTSLSFEARKSYALEQAGIQQYIDFMGISVPNTTFAEEQEALSKVDKTLGAVLMPSHFRSTKHFTINTPLGVTGNYNSVATNRKFIVFDKIDNFLKSGYGYSIAGHDAYLDVTHEPLKISEQGFVMISDEKYDEIMKNPDVRKELSKRKVIRFKGDESIAIDMVLAAHGALPTQVGYKYATYDNELREIYENSFKTLASENGLMYDKSHAGKLLPNGGGHFSNYYDEKNTDHHEVMQDFLEFLRKKFPGNEALFSEASVFDSSNSQDIVQKLGAKNILDAINEYNAKVKAEIEKKFESYRAERASITPEEHEQFIHTVRTVDEFYKTPEASSRPEVEDTIKQFFHGKSKEAQLEASNKILTILSATRAALKNVDRMYVKNCKRC